MNKTCIVIVGPTAVGKTNLSIELALHFNTSIISADSRQCFRELNIGVAKPTPEQLRSVKHYFINSHSIHDEMNAAMFEDLALNWANEIFEQRNVAVMVGGTGLYIKAFTEGLDEMPPTDQAIRANIISSYEKNGLEWLQREIQKHDPVFYQKGEIQNPQRLIRALEVKLASGESILSFRSHHKKERPFTIIKAGLELPKEILYDRIDRRVHEMIAGGLVEEAGSLLPYKHLNALQTVGYKELFEYFEGKTSLEKAIELIKQNSRHYAKRQLTWLRKDPGIRWFDGREVPNISDLLNR